MLLLQQLQQPTQPQTTDQQIQSLQQQIASLMAQVQSMTGSIPSTSYTFTKDLKLGITDLEVKYLQQYLNGHGFQVATQGPGSPNHETTRFGNATKQALIKFQEAHADQILKPWFTKGTGIFGPMTRGFINEGR